MKKINLNQLSMSWNEKQMPQKFRRYAGMLIMLLTLGVGQMWADNAGFFSDGASIVTYSKNGNSDTNLELNNSSVSEQDFGTVTAFWLKGWQFKMWKNDGGNVCDYGKMYYRIYLTSGSGGSFTELDKESTTWWPSSTNHIYHNGGSLNINILDGLVGGVYYFEYYFKAQGNWNSGSGCNDQYLNNGGSNYKIKFKYDPKYTVTVAAGTGGTVASSSVTAGNIDAVTLPTATANTGYSFVNWTTASSNLTIGSSTSRTAATVLARAAATVTANFSETMSTVSLVASPSGKGTFTIGGAAATSTTAGVTTTRSVTAVPISGYHFVSWSITGGASISSTTTNPTTVTGGGAGTAATLTATFAADATNTLTVTATAGGSITTPAAGYYSDITTTGYSIAASRSEGYKFTGWTKTAGDGAVSFSDASALSTTATITTLGDVTVTAGFAAMSNSLSVSSSSVYAGSDVTLTATKTNHTLDLKYQYKIGSGSWNTITTKSGTSHTYTIPYANTYQTYYFRVVSTDGSTDIISPTQTVEVKGRITIHVKNTNSWASMYLYSWYNDGSDHTTNGVWPGATGSGSNQQSCSIHATGSLWWDVTITQETATAQEFILNKNGSNNQDKTDDLSLSDFTHDAYYAMSTNGSAVQTLSPATAPAAPTATTNDANNITSTSVVFNYSVSANRDKTTPGIAFMQSDDEVDATTIYSSGTKVPGIAILDGNASGSTAAQTITPGKKYYYVAYGTNGFGTSYGTVKSFVAPYKVTITQPTGCSAITPGTGTQYVHVGDEISSTAATGYTFSSWSVTNVTLSSPTTTTGVTRSTITAAAENGTIAPAYTENMTTVNLVASPSGKGTFTKSGAAVTSVSAGVTTKPEVTAVPGTGYHLTGTIWSESSEYISISSTTTAATTITATGATGQTANLTATFTPNTYTVQFHRNGGAGVVVTQDFTYDEAQNLTANTYTKTGYNFAGWALTTDGDVTYANSAEVSNLTSDNGVDFHLYAKWTPKQSALTFDYQTSATGYGTSGSISAVSATYDAAMPTLSGTLPTAANGYAFMGFFDDEDGEGTQYYDGTGASVTNWDKDKTTGTTLYAYYKIAEITALTLDHPTIAPSGTVTITPTVSPTPTGTTCICWKLLRSNGNEIAATFVSNPSTIGNNVTLTAPSASGSYKVVAVLRTGNECNAGTVLDSDTANLVVAGEHTVTIRYQDGDGRTLAASGSVTGRPLAWSDAINPATITGYTFDHWVAGDGVTITADDGETTVTETTTATIKIKATYDGNLTAVYTKKDVIYFNNTLGWEHVYVYFYSSAAYWNNTYGTGAKYDKEISSTKAHWYHFWGEMTPTGDGNVYYFDYQEAAKTINPTYWSEINGYTNVVFTKDPQGFGYGDDGADADDIGDGYEWFHNTEAVRRGDFSHSLPMFVPLSDQTVETHNGTDYYNNGYWMNYPENTGYTLKIYDAWNATKETAAVREYSFPFSADKTMPLKLDVEFSNGGASYWFMVYRNDDDGTYFGNTYTYNQNYNDEQAITGGDNKCKLVTSAPGIYTLKLTYHDDGGNPKTYQHYLDVDFPVAVNDYRIIYQDEATWSNGAHTSGWNHPSDVIAKIDGEATEKKTDIVSFFIAEGSNPSMKFQYAKTIADGGAITWEDVTSGTIDLDDFSDDITKAGVYNIYVSQPVGGGSISVDSIKPYTGTYYIRTDCAGNTKWDSYTTLDHQMTYSDYSFSQTRDPYSHYYCHWVTAGTNVKFVIANDYSVCVSDTLEGDTYTTVSLVANANIRFMYNESTNKLSRAYISGSGNITDRFLVLEGDAKMYDENGNALTGDYQDHDKWGNKLGTDNQVILHDDENFVYERTIMVNPQARAKLTAKYNNNVQYFKGSEGAFTDGTTIQLLGGTTSVTKYKMRIVYDFKTNRLVTAYMPEGEIDGSIDINADMMLIREHQDAATQLTFVDDEAELTAVKTVYGVMRFNRWTLNNRANPGDHDKEHSDTDSHISTYHPLLDPGSTKSIYERALFWISFPFDVNLSDVFGFGTYGEHWIMMDYNGAERARIGYWKDNEDGFWEYIWDRRGVTLKAGRGYVLALELDLMQANDRTFWSNEIQQVELFFPSTSSTTGTIKQTAVDVTVPEHECTIDRRTQAQKDANINDWDNDRRVADSHWNIIGVPSYANYGSELTDGTSTITWQENPKEDGLPFLYDWNPNDNTYTVQSGTTFTFKAMHAYYVQYTGRLHWTLASATPSSIVARRTYAEEPQEIEFKLELQQNEKMVDQTFVKLSNDEEVSANFVFGEDMDKEFNAGKANVYTFIEGYIPTAGNTLPMSEQTTIIPMGVKIQTAGEYTFSIPNGTEGVGVTLIDNEAGTRTSLSALDYTVTLNKGTYDERFVIEISPVQGSTTDVEKISDEGLEMRDARKVIIDQKLFIIKGDKMYDARGAMVK